MKPSFMAHDEIDRKALAHRRALGFRDDQPIDGMTLITKLKAMYPEFNYLRIPDGEAKDGEAQWDSKRKLLIIPESTFCGMNSGARPALAARGTVSGLPHAQYMRSSSAAPLRGRGRIAICGTW